MDQEHEDYADPDQRPRWLRPAVVEVVSLLGLFVAAVAAYCAVVPRFFPWFHLD